MTFTKNTISSIGTAVRFCRIDNKKGEEKKLNKKNWYQLFCYVFTLVDMPVMLMRP
jgi:hypothetical protein